MRLLEFCSLIQPQRGDGPLDREVTGVAWDCRRVAPGDLFLALPTAGRDTQSAVDMAIERGASAVMCQGREVVSLRATRLQVADLRATLPRVAELFFGQPDRRLKVIGIVGAFGTSAPAMLLKSFVEASGLKCGLIGSADCEIGDRRLPPLRKGAESLDYQELMGQMVRANCNACIIELSPDAIDTNRVNDIAFDVVIFGALGERKQSMWNFCRTLSNGPKRFTGAFDVDDPAAKALWESGACRESISFGFNTTADVRGSELEFAHSSMGMLIAAGATEIRCRTQFTGRQNAFNLLAAAAGAVACRVPLQLVRFRAQKIKTLPGAMEFVGNNDIPVYVDGSRTELELRRALESLREITRGSVLLVFGSQGGESLEARRRLGSLAASLANYTVITTDNPGREGAMDIAEELERGFFGRGESTHHIELDRAQAIEEIIQMATPGDAVLIAGKGDVRHQEFADTIVPFDDRDYARAALELHGTGLAKAHRVPTHAEVLEPIHEPAHAHV